MEDENLNDPQDEKFEQSEELPVEGQEVLTRVTGMYKDWFLDYASYVILERAVPALEDGFKPVQRRIMHSMKDLDDGRYNKVANIVGHTMQYHPHGDASIGRRDGTGRAKRPFDRHPGELGKYTHRGWGGSSAIH